jgi:hypothetical protein
MRVIYLLIVLYLSLHFIWYLFRQKNFWNQASAVLVLALLLLRLFLIK